MIAPLVSSNSSYNLFIAIIKTGTYKKISQLEVNKQKREETTQLKLV
jgi:hypothetical protein